MLIPTRDRAELLQRALATALAQRDVSLEVVVIDDGSVDGTASWLGALDEPRVRVIRHDLARGVARARNAGIASARGTWLAFLDDDDVWSPEKLRLQLETAGAAKASFVYAAAILVDEELRALETLELPAPEEIELQLLERHVMPAGCSNVLARADLVRGLGGFDPALSVLADWDFWIRLTAESAGAACPETLVAYVQHEASMFVTRAAELDAEFEYLIAKHRSTASARGRELDALAFSRAAAWAHRRAGRPTRAAATYLRAAVAHRSLGNVVRALRALAGERRPAPGSRVGAVPEPAWLDLYRRPPSRSVQASRAAKRGVDLSPGSSRPISRGSEVGATGTARQVKPKR